MMLNLQIALEYLLHFIVIQWIYEKTSLVKIPRMILPIAFLVECIGGILGMSYNVGLSFMTPFYLLSMLISMARKEPPICWHFMLSILLFFIF